MNQTTKIEISLKSVIYFLGLIVLIIVAWKIRWVLVALFIAFVLMSGFAPLVDWLTKNGVNKTFAIALTYLLAIGFLAILFFLALPPLILETRDFVSRLPFYVDTFSISFNNTQIPGVSNDTLTEIVSKRLDQTLSNLLQFALNVFNIFISFITIAVFTFYLLLEREKVKRNIPILFPHLPRKEVEDLAHRVEQKTGAWVRGQLILMVSVGLATFIGLTLLGVEFALPLAVIAGLLELVPIIGPIISAIPAVIIAFTQGPLLGLATLALYLLIQQLENNILVPKVMEKVVGLSPLITIFAILVGGSLFGVLGAVLAVPVAAIGYLIISEHLKKSKDLES